MPTKHKDIRKPVTMARLTLAAEIISDLYREEKAYSVRTYNSQINLADCQDQHLEILSDISILQAKAK